MNGPGTNILRAVLLATSSFVVAGAPCPVKAGGPTGAQVVVGKATITRPNAYETLINQASNKALIDWTSFSVPSGFLVDFNQPGKSSLTVNRVTGPDVSQIDGKLLANGALWIINANGILFARGSEVNVGALLATTSDIDNADLGDGHYGFSKRSPNPNASVVNRGTIHAASGGSVVMSAARVSNQGTIEASLGKVVLGGANAFSVDMVGDNLIRYQITAPVTAAPKGADGKTAPALVSNSGTISADGGRVLMTASAAKNVQDDVINNSGIVEATSVSAHDGEIDLDAGPNGTVDAGGTLNASGNAAGEKGGTIEVAGNNVHVENGATLNASGDAGGGTVLIGGGFHGRGPIANAATTLVGKATIDVDALEKGNGGRVAVWSDKHTVFAGKISTRGGRLGGNGGYVETSSGVSLQIAFDAVVNASAPSGSKGTWLLDPLNIIIETGGTTQLDNGVLGLNQDQGKTDTVDPGTITSALNSTNVLLEAANDITVLNDVLYNSTNSLLLLAEHDINAYANIQNSMASGGGGVYLIAGWNGTTTNISQLTNNGVYGNNGGSVFVGTTNALGSVAVGSASGETVAAGNDVTVEADSGYAQIGYAGTGIGNIDVLATGNVTVDALQNPYAQIGNGGYDISGNIGGNINVNAAGLVTVESQYSDPNGIEDLSAIGNTGGSNASESGNITVTAPGGIDDYATGSFALAYIGNVSYGALSNTNGSSTGNITLSTGVLNLEANSNEGEDLAIIGNGQFNTDATNGGDINITASALNITADQSSGFSQARIADRSDGNVTGNIDITTTGDIDIVAGPVTDVQNDAALSAIGLGEGASGTTTGNITIDAGGSILISAQAGGQARIADGAAAGNTVSVTAAGDITLQVSGSGQYGDAFIGNLGSSTGGGGAVDVTSTGGDILLESGVEDAVVLIGNSANGGSEAIGGNVKVIAPEGSVTLDASDPSALVEIGNTTQGGTGSVGGDVSVTAGSTLDIEGGAQSIVGNEGNAGDISGSVTLSADYVSDIDASFLNDIPNGDFTVINRRTATDTDNEAIYYSSPYTFSYTTGGNLIVEAPFQNSGSGAINVTAGGNILIGGPNANGNVSVGSYGGTTTITADNLTVEADNGLAQLGYAGAGGGNIDVNTTGNVTVADLYDQDTGFQPDAQIGNGGVNVSGVVGGNIDIKAGGTVTLLDDSYASDVNCNYCNLGVSLVGNMGGPNTTGNIVLDATGDLNLVAEGADSVAQIGNIDLTDDNGGLTGNITISAGDIFLLADGAIIGRATIGQDLSFDMTGATGGNIDITADSLTMTSVSGPNSFDQARITNRGAGDVFGNVDVTISGNIALTGDGGGTVTEIGDGTVCTNPPCGTTKGNITIQSGGTISLFGENGGNARIQDTSGVGNTITVTAAGDITLETSGTDEGDNGDAMILDFDPASGGGDNIDVTSTQGSISLIADTANSFAFIGSAANVYNVRTSGNVAVSADGDVVLSATASGAHAQIGNDGATSGVSTSGDIVVTAGYDIDMGNGQQELIGNTGSSGDVSGDVTLTAQYFDDINSTILDDLRYGNFTLHDLNSNPVFVQSGFDYSSPYTFSGTFIGDVAFEASVLNSGAGAIDITSGGTITIGGSGAKGNVAFGSAGGTTTIDAANLVLAADNGYAQLGFDGAGDGAIDVTTTGNVSLDGGAGAEDFAQIGKGGYQTSGSESGDITIVAGGDITLSGGSGALAYAQIGSGGAESNQNSKGYEDLGEITLSGDNITLIAGSGNAAYAQIGNGGYEDGKGLTGNGTESGNINLTAVNSITLDGNGTDAYAQIGNGGDQVDLDASAAASGGATGDITITVTATGGSVTLAAGAGNDAYVQIGNGGYAEDAPNGNAANFLTAGDISVSASTLSLTGGNSGDNAYAQVGNGDASQAGDADVDGDVTISVVAVSTVDGTASGAPAVIGNETGTGTVSGTVAGGGGTTDTETINTVTALTQSATASTEDLIFAVFTPVDNGQSEYETEETLAIAPPPLTPLEQMANASSNGDSSYEGSESSDDLAASLGQSLDPARGRKKNAYVTVRTLIPGVLKQIVSTTVRNPRGIPPADENYSSWGNEALWK